MIKQKLINKRIEKNKTQEEIAHFLGITQSQYSRRESGVTKIAKSEWNALIKVLDTTLETIYEPEDGVYVLINEKKAESFEKQNVENYEFTFAIMKKYIEKLENENKSLRLELDSKK
ncbi:helix-turn-helix transcriptional regulator [Flavobacterium daemonense]|uniref:helix-turn-helix transcriptional regulator n=1 Tax=Flavobacterium daemonense TaxID=1393049 RepID=UPI00118483F7|nr:helix-turn-helix transcriptional regulator [Flavobacterium daemonense]KAF2329087.1 helix-turn-helix transcriptional regulator [Flavobacterium daemonense]